MRSVLPSAALMIARRKGSRSSSRASRSASARPQLHIRPRRPWVHVGCRIDQPFAVTFQQGQGFGGPPVERECPSGRQVEERHGRVHDSQPVGARRSTPAACPPGAAPGRVRTAPPRERIDALGFTQHLLCVGHAAERLQRGERETRIAEDEPGLSSIARRKGRSASTHSNSLACTQPRAACASASNGSSLTASTAAVRITACALSKGTP